MGTDSKAVVDTSMKLNGIDGLRVSDSSFFPSIVSSNTNAPTVAVAERGADVMLEN
jgi:choline dehydrogenase